MKKWMYGALLLAVGLSMSGCKAEEPKMPPLPPTETPMESPAEPLVESPAEPVVESPEETPGDKSTVKWGIRDIRDQEKQLIYTVYNDGDTELQYGLSYALEKKAEDGTWMDTRLTDDLAFIEVLLIVEPGKTVEDSIDLSFFTLETGTYRILRAYSDTVNAYAGYLTFTVDKEGNFGEFSATAVIGEEIYTEGLEVETPKE